MALGGTPIGWDEASPAGSESVGLGDDRIRSTKTSIRNALDSEHLFASSSSTAGAHREGSARAFFGPQSSVSASGDSYATGRMMIASDTSRLFSVSGGTTLLGAGPLSLSLGSFTAPTLRHHVVLEMGEETPSSGRVVVTFPNSGFSATPFIVATSTNSNFAAAGYSVHINAKTASGFSAHIRDLDNNLIASQASLSWMALGYRAL